MLFLDERVEEAEAMTVGSGERPCLSRGILYATYPICVTSPFPSLKTTSQITSSHLLDRSSSRAVRYTAKFHVAQSKIFWYALKG